MFAILRQRDFALLWAGGLISMAGNWVLFVALPFYIYTLTGSALATGTMFIAETLPALLFGSVAGVFADRWDRKRTLVIADLLRAILLFLLLTARSVDWVWVIYIVAFVQSAIGQFAGPAASALIPRLVGEQRLLAANSLNSLSTELTRLVGPPLGGALVGLLGLPSVVLLDSASFLISAAMIALVSVPPVPEKRHKHVQTAPPASIWMGVWRDLMAGLRLVQRERWITILFIVTGIAMFGSGMTNVLLVPFVNQVLHGGAQEFGWLVTAQGIGGLLGGLIIGQVGRRVAPARLIRLSAWAMGAIMLVIVNVPVLSLVLVLVALIGFPVMGFFITAPTLLQSGVNDQYRGRIFGAFSTTNALMMLGGLGLASLLGDRLGVVSTLNIVAVLYFLAGIVALALLGRTSNTHGVPAPRG